MSQKVNEIRKLLKDANEEYANNPNLAEELEEVREKHSTLTETDLSTLFTM